MTLNENPRTKDNLRLPLHHNNKHPKLADIFVASGTDLILFLLVLRELLLIQSMLVMLRLEFLLHTTVSCPLQSNNFSSWHFYCYIRSSGSVTPAQPTSSCQLCWWPYTPWTWWSVHSYTPRWWILQREVFFYCSLRLKDIFNYFTDH